MNKILLINRMLGNWIVQSTTYSLFKKNIEASLNEIKWSLVEDKIQELAYRKQNIFPINSTNMKIYILEKETNHLQKKIYQIFLFEKKSKGYIVKLDYNFQILNQSIFYYNSENFLSVYYKSRNNIIIENIYFINDNLKVIKSIIKKNSKCIGICFSSEIRIN
uniref:Conserved hypothetical plastid protein n=1 Tax=Calliarthron tuberculosum TaxID=48942 RepID=M4ITS4_CALTB|nr:conserved hypothetical plastid protein [Calliarthron tuberculosum]AGA63895.1 conserved hypothetical plastid protein [Calliarthron tuberculosum]